MDIKTETSYTAVLTKENIRTILEDLYSKAGFTIKQISFDLEADYSDHDCDRYGPDMAFKEVRLTLDKV